MPPAIAAPPPVPPLISLSKKKYLQALPSSDLYVRCTNTAEFAKFFNRISMKHSLTQNHVNCIINTFPKVKDSQFYPHILREKLQLATIFSRHQGIVKKKQNFIQTTLFLAPRLVVAGYLRILK